jgi:hypothetical protein
MARGAENWAKDWLGRLIGVMGVVPKALATLLLDAISDGPQRHEDHPDSEDVKYPASSDWRIDLTVRLRSPPRWHNRPGSMPEH